jgi:CheY-like chemotaxis protein
VEDDEPFAKTLLELARQRGFKGVVATRGAPVLDLARRLKPRALTLDVRLPDLEGWGLLDRLKHDPTVRHIPVHIISVDDDVRRGRRRGAASHLVKPIPREALVEVIDRIWRFSERSVRALLIVDDDAAQRSALSAFLGGSDVAVTAVASGAEVLEALRKAAFDGLVLDLGLPDMSGVEVVRRIRSDLDLNDLPIVVYTGRSLTEEEAIDLKRLTQSIIVKDASAPERILDETALYLHRVEANLPELQQEALREIRKSDPALAGRKVLIVDDDIRNIFTLTSVLERKNMEVVRAGNGRAGIEALERTPGIEIVIMDIMMPEMDGYEAMRAIRAQERWRSLPIIAVTAKAMVGDRDRCIEAGASDYFAKPVNTEQLLSLMRVWLDK